MKTLIECGIQIFWTVNCTAVSQWQIFRLVAAIFFFLNNGSLGNGSATHSSKDLNATLNVGGKSNWERLMTFLSIYCHFLKLYFVVDNWNYVGKKSNFKKINGILTFSLLSMTFLKNNLLSFSISCWVFLMRDNFVCSSCATGKPTCEISLQKMHKRA